VKPAEPKPEPARTEPPPRPEAGVAPPPEATTPPAASAGSEPPKKSRTWLWATIGVVAGVVVLGGVGAGVGVALSSSSSGTMAPASELGTFNAVFQ
jgi:anti-sigma factor RsiW